MLTIKQWQRDNPQLVNRIRGQKTNLDLIHAFLVEDVCDKLEEINGDSKYLANELLDSVGPRLQTLLQLAAMFEDLSASYDELGQPIKHE